MIRRGQRRAQCLQTRGQLFGLFIERLGALQQNLDFAGLVMLPFGLQNLLDLALLIFIDAPAMYTTERMA